ncbi:MAG: phage terminase large subunit family protein [Cyanobacteria bacterium P01_A01_bin.40]
MKTLQPQTLLDRVLPKFKPPPKLTVSEWAEQRRYLSAESSAEPGRWKNDRTPYLPGIMDATCEAGVHQVAVMCSSQVGKTESESNIVGRQIDIDPCPILFLQPTLEMAEAYSKDRFDPMCRDTPVLAAKVLAKKSRDKNNTKFHKKFPGGQLTFAGANSPASLASRPVRFVLCDEIDRYPISAKDEGDPVLLAKKRTTTFWNWLLMCVSTPTVKGISRIEKFWEKSDKRRYFVNCPHCDHPQHFVWERLQYVGKGTDEADPHSGVYYICEKCDRPIEEKHKPKMVKNGDWKATAVSKDGTVGFHLNEMYSLWVRWLDICLNYESARKDEQQLRVFVNTSLGLTYEAVGGEKLDWERLRDRGKLSNYAQGIVPNGGLILTAGVDVQGDRLEVAVIAWGKGEQAYVISYEKIMGDPLQPQVWEQLAYVTGKVYQRQDRAELKIRATFIDSGYLTQEVYHRVKQYKYLHWFAIKGKSGDRPLYSKPSAQETNYRGEKVKRGISIYIIGVDEAKEALYARSQIKTPGANYINFPNDLDNSFYEGFCSEVLVTKHKNGHPYHVWEVLPGVRNEPLDLCVYALAAAYMVGITRMNLNKLESQILDNLRDKANSDQEMTVKSQANDRSSSVDINSNDLTSKNKASVKSQSNRRRGKTRSRRSRSTNFSKDI